MVGTSLKIVWNGTAPGLPEHRLSISAFGPTLNAMLQAVRRIASGIVADALGDPGYGTHGGRLAAEAQLLDLELSVIKEGSLELGIAFTHQPVPGANMELFNDLPVRAGRIFLDGIRSESNSSLKSAPVRRFLRTFPATVTSQVYELYDHGELVDRAEIGTPSFAALPTELPGLARFIGDVCGVGFEPGRFEVRLHVAGKRHVCAATEMQVEQAIRLRGKPVHAMVLVGMEEDRLLWIHPAEPPAPTMDEDARTDYMFRRWGPLLERLAQ